MKTLYALTKNNPARIKKFLVHYKLAVILKRFFRCPNLAVQKIAYKLFKKQIRYLGKKWKFLHTKLISNCFAMTPTEILDDWLVNDPPDGAAVPTDPVDDILNDSVIPPPNHPEPEDYAEYIHALGTLNFENVKEIEEFQKKFPYYDEFFFGYKNYRDYLNRILGI